MTEADELAAIDSVADATARVQAQIEWNQPGGGRLNRSQPLVDRRGPTLGLNAVQMDGACRAVALL